MVEHRCSNLGSEDRRAKSGTSVMQTSLSRWQLRKWFQRQAKYRAEFRGCSAHSQKQLFEVSGFGLFGQFVFLRLNPSTAARNYRFTDGFNALPAKELLGGERRLASVATQTHACGCDGGGG